VQGLAKFTRIGIFGLKIYIPSGNPDLHGRHDFFANALPQWMVEVNLGPFRPRLALLEGAEKLSIYLQPLDENADLI
jgi:hypothetical protein